MTLTKEDLLQNIKTSHACIKPDHSAKPGTTGIIDSYQIFQFQNGVYPGFIIKFTTSISHDINITTKIKFVIIRHQSIDYVFFMLLI